MKGIHSYIRKIKRTYYCQKQRLLKRVANKLFCHLLPGDFKKMPKIYVSLMYASVTGKILHLRAPTDINQCLMALNINRFLSGKDNDILAECADKYRVRDYVIRKGFPEILIEQYGAYDFFNDIPFDNLPNQFVLKMNNASGRILICTDKSQFDYHAHHLKKQFDDWILDHHYGLEGGEWHYELIHPKIVVEKYLSNLGESSLIDYKFHCFKGHVHSCFVCYDRVGNSVNYDHYDINWKPTSATYNICCKGRRLIPKPKNYEKMLEIASILSEEHPYVRVDLYEIEGDLFFGELTMTPSANMQLFYKQEMLDELGRAYHQYND